MKCKKARLLFIMLCKVQLQSLLHQESCFCYVFCSTASQSSAAGLYTPLDDRCGDLVHAQLCPFLLIVLFYRDYASFMCTFDCAISGGTKNELNSLIRGAAWMLLVMKSVCLLV